MGVGIRGEEGVQAVNASDFAIAQFRFLQVSAPSTLPLHTHSVDP